MSVPTSDGRLESVLEETRIYHDALDADSLADTLQNLVATRRQSLWLICRYLADMAEKSRFRDVGYDDIYDFAWKELGMRKRTVRERVRVGKALRQLPAIQDAFVVGRLGFGRVREIVRVATSETESYWLDAALDLPMRRLEAMVAEAGGLRPTRHAPRTEPLGEEMVEVRLVLPTEVWEGLESAMGVVAEAEGIQLSPAEALSVVTEYAQAHAMTRRASPAEPMDPNRGDRVRTPEDRADDPIGSPHERDGGKSKDSRTGARIRNSGADPDCSGGPTIIQHSPQEAPTEPLARPVSPAAQAMLQVFEKRRKWWPDQLADAAGISSGAETAIALSELEMIGCLEKVAGGYRVVPKHRRPLH